VPQVMRNALDTRGAPLEHGIRQSLHEHPAALVQALHSAAWDLSAQRAMVLGLLGWWNTVELACAVDPALVPTIVDLTHDGDGETALSTAQDMRASASPVLYDLAICRYIDSTISFFRDAATVGLVLDPASMRSAQKQMTHNEILGFESMIQLVASLAARKSDELARDDFQLLVFCNDKLGLPVFLAPHERQEFKTAIRTRNLLVHNAGRVDARHANSLALDESLIDTKVELDSDLATHWMELLNDSSTRVTEHLEAAWRARFPEVALNRPTLDG